MSKHKFPVGAELYDKVSGDRVCRVESQLEGVDCRMYLIYYFDNEAPVLRSEKTISKYYEVKEN